MTLDFSPWWPSAALVGRVAVRIPPLMAPASIAHAEFRISSFRLGSCHPKPGAVGLDHQSSDCDVNSAISSAPEPFRVAWGRIRAFL